MLKNAIHAKRTPDQVRRSAYHAAVLDWIEERATFGAYPDATVSTFLRDYLADQELAGDTVASCGAKVLLFLDQKGALLLKGDTDFARAMHGLPPAAFLRDGKRLRRYEPV